MGLELIKKTNIPAEDIRGKILDLEADLSKVKGVKFGDACAPLEHNFGDGCYIRKITMPKGMIFTSKIHKKKHPYFVLEGDCSVLTDKGVVRIKAPYQGITEPGTKRVLYIHEKTVWITVHVTKETDLKKIEEQIIAKTFDEVQLTDTDIKKLKEGGN